ncbi:hypothetical protein D5086_032569 [Populus alba]|uniref:Uncharacterized protein n=1 Tax=Populus alba TaxID=43335 RepID=A0ACC4AMD9_POPAL
MLKTSLRTLKSLPITTKQQTRRFTKNSVVMEAQNDKVYVQYNHTDSCKSSRWTARESFEFMHARPWQEVVDFYSKSVNGQLSLLELFGTQAHDVHCDDKMKSLVEKSLGRFVDEKKAQQAKEKCKPLEGCASVAGRTDKGVSALQQIKVEQN